MMVKPPRARSSEGYSLQGFTIEIEPEAAEEPNPLRLFFCCVKRGRKSLDAGILPLIAKERRRARASKALPATVQAGEMRALKQAAS